MNTGFRTNLVRCTNRAQAAQAPATVEDFRSKLRFEDDGGLPFTLFAPLEYVTEQLGGQSLLVVPAGFKTDLASIPRVLWSVLPPFGRYDAAAVVHDYLYQTGAQSVTRAEADAVLREAMEQLGVGWFARHTIYLGVRAGGWVVWNNYRSQEKS